MSVEPGKSKSRKISDAFKSFQLCIKQGKWAIAIKSNMRFIKPSG